MTRMLSGAPIGFVFAICIASQAAAGCVAIGWTNGHDNHPIWKCSAPELE
jgi:hypothetical protein